MVGYWWLSRGNKHRILTNKYLQDFGEDDLSIVDLTSTPSRQRAQTEPSYHSGLLQLIHIIKAFCHAKSSFMANILQNKSKWVINRHMVVIWHRIMTKSRDMKFTPREFKCHVAVHHGTFHALCVKRVWTGDLRILRMDREREHTLRFQKSCGSLRSQTIKQTNRQAQRSA